MTKIYSCKQVRRGGGSWGGGGVFPVVELVFDCKESDVYKRIVIFS